MELRHLRTFVVLAQELHFGRASRKLFVDPAAVTRTLQALEEQLRTPLLSRNRHSVTLTAAGRHFFQWAQHLLTQVEAAVDETREIAAQKEGRLTIGFSGFTGLGPAPEVLKRMRQLHPDLRLKLVHCATKEQLTSLREGWCDVALSAMPLREREVTAVPLMTESLMLLISTQHHLARQPRVAFKALVDETHLLAPRAAEPLLHQAFRRAFVHSKPSKKILEVADLSTLLTLVAANEGVSYAPQSVMRLGYQGICMRPLRPLYEVSCFAVFLKKTTSPWVQVFLDAFRELVGEG